MLDRRCVFAIVAAFVATFAACRHKHRATTNPLPARTFRMGFSWFPPRPELPLALDVIDAFAPHADQALILVSPPWTRLLAGDDPVALVTANELGLADLYRGLGLPIVVSIDPTNGLDRSLDAPELSAAGRSIAEPAVQTLFVDYAVAMATLLQPEHLALASETNLVRSIAPMTLYDGMRVAANAAAAAIRTAAPDVACFFTIQTEVAWGLPGGGFVGTAQDLADFPFTTVLGVSSFPYLAGVADPAALPDDYFARLTAGTGLPLLMLEGGWPSVTVLPVASDPAKQARYVTRNAELLDQAAAIGWFQITFTDLEVTAYSPGIAPFADLGLVLTTLQPKSALANWDAVLARPHQ